MRHTSSSGVRARHPARAVSWKRLRVAAGGTAIAAALAGTSLTGVQAAAAGPAEEVIVTSTGPLSPVNAVLGLGGSILTQYNLIDGVEALVPQTVEQLLSALPGITVT